MARLVQAGAPVDRASAGLVLLHGRGAGAEDILGLGAALALPDVALIAPEAPGRSWWPTSFLAPSAAMEPYVEDGLSAVQTAITELRATGIASDRIALAGFSQGACLALEYVARRGGVSGVFGLSGGLVGTGDAGDAPQPELYGFAEKAFDYTSDLSGMPAVIEVHERDPHIPLKRAERSISVFETLGADTMLHVIPGGGHGVGQAGIAALRAHLNRPAVALG